MTSNKNKSNAPFKVTVGKQKITINYNDLGTMHIQLKTVREITGQARITLVESMILDAALRAGFIFSNFEIREMAEEVVQAVFPT